MPSFELKETPYGFKWGPMGVFRIGSMDRFGVMIEIVTPKQTLMIRSTPTGFIRVAGIQKNMRGERDQRTDS